MRQVVRLVFLFVGVVIGAGFATGSEIVLYFKDNGYFSLLSASVIMGIFSVAFCYFGKLKKEATLVKNLSKIVVFFSSIVTYCVMISGVSELIATQFSVKYFGIITAFAVAILMLYDIKIIKLLNLIIVPLIVVIMLILLIVSGGEIGHGFNIISSFKYAGMNMLLGGYFLSDEGEDLTGKQIVYVGLLVALVMGLLMSVCYFISMQATTAGMPVFEVARKFELGGLAASVVFLAIFTTLIGSGRVFASILEEFFPCKALIFILVFALGCLFDGLDFAALIDFCYGYIGKIGFVVCMAVIVSLIFHLTKKRAKKTALYKG